MLARREAEFEARWTKGHPLPRHLATLQSSELDAWGNVGADLLAGVASRTTNPAELARARRTVQCPRL